MSLRSQLAGKVETLQEFSLAAAEKYDEGQRLIAENDFGAGIYLLGYAAEMILKNAYFRFTGAAVSDEIGPRLFPAKAAGDDRHGGGLIPGISPESFHSLRFWAMLLQSSRANQKRLWTDVEFVLEFERCTERLYNNWWVEMRYRTDLANHQQALQVLSDVGWLRNHQTTLWS